MKNKILLGIFLTGILLMGIGAGIAFGEYSEFTYGGEMIVGNEKGEVQTEEYIISLGDKKTRIVNYASKTMDVVEDKQLKDGQVRVEVISNPDYVKSYHYYEDYENTDYSPEYISDYEGEIQVHLGRTIGDFELMMKYKDDFLENLKNSKIKSYYLDAVKSVTVKANAKTLEYLEH